MAQKKIAQRMDALATRAKRSQQMAAWKKARKNLDIVDLIIRRVEELEITQSDLAAASGITTMTISRTLNRRVDPSITTAAALLAALGVEISFEGFGD